MSQKVADRWIRFWRMHFYRFGRRRTEQDRPLPAVVRRSFETKNLFPEPKLGWEELVTGGVEIHEISGDHKLHRDLMAGKFVSVSSIFYESILVKESQARVSPIAKSTRSPEATL